MTDYTTISRTEWISLADRLYDRLENDCRTFSTEEWAPVTPYLGWRVRDVLAHLTTAMPINFRPMLDRALADNPSPPPEFNTFVRNARAVAERRSWPIDQVLREYRTETDAIMAVYRGMSDAEWLKPAWFYVGPVNVRTLFLAQLGDTMFHERDLLLVNGRWHGFDPAYGALVDWFIRELRPATFRPDQSVGLRSTAVFRITGVGAGAWSLTVQDRACSVTAEAVANPDIVFEADTEDLVAAGQARANPVIGSFARVVAPVLGPDWQEDTVATVTGVASLASGLLRGRLKIKGNIANVYRFNNCFWQYWQRTRQTQLNISHPPQS
jgi:uncharacterized protein (TIGR03083 family)